ncbi:hypothetical protein CORC01_05644 [Colletotrichum orchidophilum]|uniref:Uncharacterized protein n=1 Tax=Colletotrichum orchidophilum TaxID=1209926 RepID=A0A1G4BC14_9PEZI|nr:uncharacterized protein CORC01_05644 [Colletotrichum orchidophilum]OHE98954.1 hypothetical protein CORC01_05644 [Colletotrichum orchidophilum]
MKHLAALYGGRSASSVVPLEQPSRNITALDELCWNTNLIRKLAVEQQWFAVCGIVFPGRPPPGSPYVYSPTREVAKNMRSY